MNKQFADDLPYWKTSKMSVDSWFEKAKEEIKRAGGQVLSSMYGDDNLGRSAFVIWFKFGQDEFRLSWPVMQPKNPRDFGAAKVQAVTMLYHVIKARAVEVRVRGARAAFFGDLMLSDGRTASESTGELFLERLPGLLPAPKG